MQSPQTETGLSIDLNNRREMMIWMIEMTTSVVAQILTISHCLPSQKQLHSWPIRTPSKVARSCNNSFASGFSPEHTHLYDER